jgi:hypothetical protein
MTIRLWQLYSDSGVNPRSIRFQAQRCGRCSITLMTRTILYVVCTHFTRSIYLCYAYPFYILNLFLLSSAAVFYARFFICSRTKFYSKYYGEARQLQAARCCRDTALQGSNPHFSLAARATHLSIVASSAFARGTRSGTCPMSKFFM